MPTSPYMQTNPKFIYVPYWARDRLASFDALFNGFFLFHAPGRTTGSIGSYGGTHDPTTGFFSYLPPDDITAAAHAAEIAARRAAGDHVLMSVGGAGGQIQVNNQTQADNFVQCVKDHNDYFGGFTYGSGTAGTTMYIDGIDLNHFEGAAASPFWNNYAMAALKAYYGPQFLITSPVAGFSLAPPPSQGGLDRDMVGEMYRNGNIDWVAPQCYDPSNLNTLTRKREVIDFYGAPFTYNSNAIDIPNGYIGIGEGVLSDAGTWTSGVVGIDDDPNDRTSSADINTHYQTLVSDGREPKGLFIWSSALNKQAEVASLVLPNITNNTSGGGGPTTTNANQYGVVDASTLSKVMGIDVSLVTTYRGYGVPSSLQTPALLDSSQGAGLDSVTTAALDSTGASLLVAVVSCQDLYVDAITDNQGNTWTELTSYTNADPKVRTFYVKNPTTNAAHTVTAPNTTGQVIGSVFFAAFSGTELGAFTPQQNGNNSAGATTIATGAVTPNTDNSLVIAAIGINGAGLPITMDSGFTVIESADFVGSQSYGGALGWKVVPTIASTGVNITRTNVNNQAATIVSFDAAA